MSYLLRVSKNFNSIDLTSAELSYYAKQILLPGFGIVGQRKLKVARVLVIGAGGLGCPILQSLAGAGIGHISIVDGDDISISNLSRQWLHRYEDKDKNKAVSAAKRLFQINTFIKLEAHPMMLDHANARELIKSHDLIIDATDGLAVRYLIDDVCADLNCPWIHAALYKDKAQLTVFWDTYGASFRRLYPEPSVIPSCSETGILGAYASLIGNMQAIEAIKIITGMTVPKVGELVTLDLEKNNINTFYIPNVNPPRLYTDDYEYNSDYSLSIKALEKSVISDDSFTILDIRHRNKFDENCIDDAIYYPAERILEEGLDHINTANILLICEEGPVSALLANAMNQSSKDVFYLEGGMRAWTKKLTLDC